MLSSPKVACRTRAFDVMLNLGIHAHLLEPISSDDTPSIEEDEALRESSSTNTDRSLRLGNINSEPTMQQKTSSAIDNFESWLLVILFENLGFLVQVRHQYLHCNICLGKLPFNSSCLCIGISGFQMIGFASNNIKEF